MKRRSARDELLILSRQSHGLAFDRGIALNDMSIGGRQSARGGVPGGRWAELRRDACACGRL